MNRGRLIGLALVGGVYKDGKIDYSLCDTLEITKGQLDNAIKLANGIPAKLVLDKE